MSRPARPDLVFHDLNEMLADVERLRGGYHQAGQWDLPMILDHLHKGISGQNQKPVPWPFSLLARAVIHRMVRREKYPAFKVPAPSAMRPTPNIPMSSAYPRFITTVKGLQSHPGPEVKNTPFGALPLAEFTKLHLLHGAHHLSYLSAH